MAPMGCIAFTRAVEVLAQACFSSRTCKTDRDLEKLKAAIGNLV
jgi:hypothetical protein